MWEPRCLTAQWAFMACYRNKTSTFKKSMKLTMKESGSNTRKAFNGLFTEKSSCIGNIAYNVTPGCAVVYCVNLT
jgi:hypothetical protein